MATSKNERGPREGDVVVYAHLVQGPRLEDTQAIVSKVHPDLRLDLRVRSSGGRDSIHFLVPPLPDKPPRFLPGWRPLPMPAPTDTAANRSQVWSLSSIPVWAYT